MPTYEYECLDCGIFERFAKMSECSNPTVCRCGREAGRIISAPRLDVKSPSAGTQWSSRWHDGWNYSLGCKNTDKAITKRRKELEKQGRQIEMKRS